MHGQLSSGAAGLVFVWVFIYINILPMQVAKAQARLHRSTGSSEPFLLADVISIKIPCAQCADSSVATNITLVNVYIDLVVFTRIAGTS